MGIAAEFEQRRSYLLQYRHDPPVTNDKYRLKINAATGNKASQVVGILDLNG
jgi:hypothetical protein